MTNSFSSILTALAVRHALNTARDAESAVNVIYHVDASDSPNIRQEAIDAVAARESAGLDVLPLTQVIQQASDGLDSSQLAVFSEACGLEREFDAQTFSVVTDLPKTPNSSPLTTEAIRAVLQAGRVEDTKHFFQEDPITVFDEIEHVKSKISSVFNYVRTMLGR